MQHEATYGYARGRARQLAEGQPYPPPFKCEIVLRDEWSQLKSINCDMSDISNLPIHLV
jgi:hypothetical protein